MNGLASDEAFVSAINAMFEKIPFNKTVGLKVESIRPDSVQTVFEMRDELVGNYERGMLHGGVISTVIDATGGLAAAMGFNRKMRNNSVEEKIKRSFTMRTIDLRVDFLRPGLGKRFVITASALRTGNRVIVAKIELHNDENVLIAVGTGSYILSG